MSTSRNTMPLLATYAILVFAFLYLPVGSPGTELEFAL